MSGCRSCVDIEFHVHFELGDADAARSQAVPERRGAPHPRRHHVDRALPEVPVRRAAAAAEFGPGPARLVIDHPEYQVWVELTDDAARRARRRLRRASTPWRSGSSGSIPSCRCRASSTPTTPAYDLHARERVELARRRRARPGADRARDRDPVGLRRVRTAPVGPRAEVRHHLPQHAGAHRLRSTAASSRCCW